MTSIPPSDEMVISAVTLAELSAAAAVAHAQGLPLYTTNPDDFVGLEQLITVKSVPRRR